MSFILTTRMVYRVIRHKIPGMCPSCTGLEKQTFLAKFIQPGMSKIKASSLSWLKTIAVVWHIVRLWSCEERRLLAEKEWWRCVFLTLTGKVMPLRCSVQLTAWQMNLSWKSERPKWCWSGTYCRTEWSQRLRKADWWFQHQNNTINSLILIHLHPDQGCKPLPGTLGMRLECTLDEILRVI